MNRCEIYERRVIIMRTHTKIRRTNLKFRMLSLFLAVILAIPTISVVTPTTASAATVKAVYKPGKSVKAGNLGKFTATKVSKKYTRYTTGTSGYDDIKIYQYPSTKATEVRTVNYSTEVTVIAKVTTNNLSGKGKSTWYYVQVEKGTKPKGYIQASNLASTKPKRVVTSSKKVTWYVTGSNVRLREEPNTSADILVTMTCVKDASKDKITVTKRVTKYRGAKLSGWYYGSWKDASTGKTTSGYFYYDHSYISTSKPNYSTISKSDTLSGWGVDDTDGIDYSKVTDY
jgi:hypothetical protein